MSTRIRLADDGTLDTVLVCRQCGAEARYTYDGRIDQDADPVPEGKQLAPGVEYGCGVASCKDCYTDADGRTAYDEFVEWAIEDFDSEHECEEVPE